MFWLLEKTYCLLLPYIWVKRSYALIPLKRNGLGGKSIILRQNNMSSISVAKHKKQRTPIGALCFLAGTPRSKHAPQAKRGGMGFAFEPKADGSSLTRVSAKNHGVKRSYPSAQNGQSRTPVPTVECVICRPQFPANPCNPHDFMLY